MTSIERIRQALAAGPTEGPWRACDSSALKGDWTCYDDSAGQSTWQPIVDQQGRAVAFIVDSSRHPFDRDRASFSADAALIAACSPDAIRSLLSRLDELEKDAARLDWMAKNLYWDGNAYWIPEICVRERGWGEEYTPEPTAAEFRAAIDSAIAKGA